VDCEVDSGDGSQPRTVTAEFTVTPSALDGTLMLSPPAGSAASFFFATATWPATVFSIGPIGDVIGPPALVEGPPLAASTLTQGCFDPAGVNSPTNAAVVQFD